MEALINSILASILISLVSLIGIFLVGIKSQKIEKIIFFLVSFSAGSLIGGAFFHLLPEAIQENDVFDQLFPFKMAIFGFVFFFLLEKILRWRHCHKFSQSCKVHRILGYQNLVGDSIHNFIDGLIVFAAFSVNFKLGLLTTFSVILHEIPQEIGDFGVLIFSGFSKQKALFFNFISAVFAIGGVLIGFFLVDFVGSLINFLIPLAAGGFVYVAASDLIPEIHREKNLKKSLISFVVFLLALFLMLFFAEWE